MTGTEDQRDFEPFRDYLTAPARMKIPDGLRARVDPHDLVQQTLLCAHRDRAQFHGRTEAELAGWLRQILAFRLVDEVRKSGRSATISLERELERSSGRLADLIAANQSTPSARLRRQEDALEVAKFLAQLSAAQAEAVLLRHCEGWPVERICLHMARSPEAVGGLLRHGMARLRELIGERDRR